MSILNFRKLLIKSLKSTAAVTARLVKRSVYNSNKVYAANVTDATYDSPIFGELPVVNFASGVPTSYNVKHRCNFARFMKGIKSLFEDLDKNVQIYDPEEYPCIVGDEPRYPTVFEALFKETVGAGVCPFEKADAPEGVTVRLRPATGFTAKTGKWDYYGAEVMGVSTEVSSKQVQFYVYPNGDALDLVAPENSGVSLSGLELNFTLPGFKTSTCTLPEFPTVFSAMFNEDTSDATPLVLAGTQTEGCITLSPNTGFTAKTNGLYGSSSVSISTSLSDEAITFTVAESSGNLELTIPSGKTRADFSEAVLTFSAGGYTSSEVTLGTISSTP